MESFRYDIKMHSSLSRAGLSDFGVAVSAMISLSMPHLRNEQNNLPETFSVHAVENQTVGRQTFLWDHDTGQCPEQLCETNPRLLKDFVLTEPSCLLLTILIYTKSINYINRPRLICKHFVCAQTLSTLLLLFRHSASGMSNQMEWGVTQETQH